MRTRAVVVLGAVLTLAACGQPGGGAGSPAPSTEPSTEPVADLPSDGDALVLRVTQDGGFAPPGADLTLLPLISVYRDGRVLSQGPTAAIYPGYALPNVQVNRVDDATLTELVQAAQEAGVGGTADLGDPSIADARTTTITLTTAEGTTTRDVYALAEAVGDPSLTDEEAAARQRLADLVDRLTELTATDPLGPYTPTGVAALAQPYTTADPQVDAAPLAWPGPQLPGEAVGAGVGCTVATGGQAAEVLAAAQQANTLTPWTDGGATWSVAFRPLLPDETGCADLTG